MKNSTPLASLLTFSFIFSLACVSAQIHGPLAPCTYDKIQKDLELSEPQANLLFKQARQQAYYQLVAEKQSRSTSPTPECPNGIRIIPLYFHILHNWGDSTVPGDNNFTTAEISAAVDNLNAYYHGTNYSLERVQDEFWAQGIVSANTCIQFCWNTSDVRRVNLGAWPLNSTVLDANGEIRTGADAQIASTPKSKCQYVNVYIGSYGIGPTGGGILGYAYNLFTGAAGVRIDDNVFVPNGPITNKIDSNATSLAHEIAHFLGINHIWGAYNISDSLAAVMTAGTFCGIDDGIDDTPLQGRPCIGTGTGVPSLIQNEVVVHCGHHIMWTNFMDYTRRDWRVNFTKDQASFMRLYLTQAANLLPVQPTCDVTGGFLNGEARCNNIALSCASLLINIPYDTVRICNADTINLLKHLDRWGYNNHVSPTTEYSFRKNSLSGPVVDFPAKTVVQGFSPICHPDTIEYFLNIKCATSGTEQLGGKVVVIAYSTPEQLMAKYLRNGDCQNGPGPVYPPADLAAGCDQLVTFTPLSTPTFPTNVSGSIAYNVTFSPSVLGPCCTSNCNRTDTAYYYCQVPVNACPGVAVSGGLDMIELAPCPELDFSTLYDGYENNLVSIFDPNHNINSFYYYSDVNRTITFDPSKDYFYDGDGCHHGSDIVIYTSLGCDTDHNGVPNTYITLGSITLQDPSAPAQAPTITYTTNSNHDCVYTIHKACSQDDVTPSLLPIQVCGASNLPVVTFSVLTDDGCEATFVVPKPDCPNCTVVNCASSTFSGGNESVCSGSTLSAGLPDLPIINSTGPVSNIFWATQPIGGGGGLIYPGEPDDLSDWSGPVFTSANPGAGTNETQTLYAYALCDDDNNSATDAVYSLLGQYVVTINPVPDGRAVPVCHSGDSLNYYIEVELFTNNAGHTFTATNSFNASSLTFSAPDVKQLGPFPNGSGVSVNFGIDGGCSSQSETFNTGCLSSSCSAPEVVFSKICINNDPSQYYVDVTVTGTTTGYLFEITNSTSSDTSFISMQDTSKRIGPFASSVSANMKVLDYTHRNCYTQSGPLTGPCTFNSVETVENSIMELYPNPTSGKLTIENAKEEIRIFNLLGQEVLTQKIVADKTELDISGFASGFYYVKSKNGVRKFLKE